MNLLPQKPTDLNTSQREAVQYRGGNLLIVAGPGTGKTHTLTYRMTQVVQTLQTEQEILAITFTNKAAIEMNERLNQRLEEKNESFFVGTFHQFCFKVLKKHINLVNAAKEFKVASLEEVEQIAKKLWPNNSSAERKKKLTLISGWKTTQFDVDKPKDAQLFDHELYEQGFFDFDDLLLKTVRLLENYPDVLNEFHQHYPYIFVDEYQDINRIQHTLLKLLVTHTSCLTAIGEPNQAIYGFRGSDVTYFDSFISDFPGSKLLFLEENYRCAKNILSASTQILAKQLKGNIPELIARIYTQGKLIVHAPKTEKGEAEYVVHQIEKLIGGTSLFSQDSGRVNSAEKAELSFGDIAVFYRLNSQRFALQKALDRSGIPHEVFGVKKKTSSESVIDDLYDVRNDENALNVEKVSLMTLHASKGLEFSCVFMVGCENNLLPLNISGLISNVEEERRLFYVGMTRAKEYLFLTHAKRRCLYGKIYHNEPSPFLNDIAESLKEYEKIQQRVKKQKQEDPQMTLF